MVAMSRACSVLIPFSSLLDSSESGARSCPRAGTVQNLSTGAELGITSVLCIGRQRAVKGLSYLGSSRCPVLLI